MFPFINIAHCYPASTLVGAVLTCRMSDFHWKLEDIHFSLILKKVFCNQLNLSEVALELQKMASYDF